MSNPRYEGKPLLRLLECYILKCVGQLSSDQETMLAQMEAGLSKTFGVDGNWCEIISQKMEFSAELPGHLREMWRQNVAAGPNQTRLSPEHFAQYVVDSSFSHLV